MYKILDKVQISPTKKKNGGKVFLFLVGPQCRCTTVPITPKFEDFIKYEEAILAGEDVSNYQFKGRIKKALQKFKVWCKENE